MSAATALVESKLDSGLKKFLKKHIVKKNLSDELADGVSGAEKVILPTGGHFMNHILIDEYNKAVGDFLSRQSVN